MEAVIGFVLGIATVILFKEYPACQPRKARRTPSEDERRLRREYENFLSYEGEEQDG